MLNEVSVFLSDELLAAVDASPRTVPELIQAGLEAAERAGGERADEVWLAGLVADLVGKLNAGYVLVPRK